MKDQRKANLGKPFEDFLKITHRRYQQLGIACVHKVPTEFIPLRNVHGAIVSCKVEEKSCVDYLGRYKGIPVAVEAKHEAGKRISFSRVEPHQAAYLDDFTKDKNAIGLVVVSFGMTRFFAVPWIFWKTAREEWEQRRGTCADKTTVMAYGMQWTTTGMASVSADEMLPAWEVKIDSVVGLPYLGVIEKMR